MLFLRNCLNEYKFFVFVETVEQAEGALVKIAVYPHVHRHDPINIPVRSL